MTENEQAQPQVCQKKAKTFLWSFLALLIGLIFGVTSQRIPEIKVYTDEIIVSISKFQPVKELKSRLGYLDEVYAKEIYSPFAQNYINQDPRPGQPISSFVIHRQNYSLAYDAQHHNPAWIYEHLTADNLKGESNHLFSEFKEDESIPEHLRASLVDYNKGRGLERGQMASAANYRSNQDALSETFFLTNTCPQCPQLNQGFWSKLENHVRDLTKNYRHVYVITGPLYLPYQEHGARFVKYRVIGPNDVAVPSHFFKVLLLDNEVGTKEMVAYILPNYEIPLDYPIDNFRTSVSNVEKAAGMIFR